MRVRKASVWQEFRNEKNRLLQPSVSKKDRAILARTNVVHDSRCVRMYLRREREKAATDTPFCLLLQCLPILEVDITYARNELSLASPASSALILRVCAQNKGVKDDKWPRPTEGRRTHARARSRTAAQKPATLVTAATLRLCSDK